MENNFDSIYPPKPFLEKETKVRKPLPATVISIVLFAMTFLLFFGSNYVFLAEILGVLIVHELGHFAMMKLYKYQNVRMLFVPFMGAFVHGSKEEYRQRESMTVIMAGPIPGIVLGIAFWVLGNELESAWMREVSLLSFFLNIINLLPLQPLDGGKLMSVLFMEKLEFFQIVFTFLSSLIMIVLGFYWEIYIIMAFGFLMGFQVRSMHRKYLIHKVLRESEVDYKMTYEHLSDRSYHLIKNEVLEQTPALRRFVSATEDQEDVSKILANEVKNVLVAPLRLDVGTGMKFIAVLLWLLSIAGPIYLIFQTDLNALFNAV